MLVVGRAALRLFHAHVKAVFSGKPLQDQSGREVYVAGLLLALEVLVAAGVLTIVLHPSWSAIGKLAAIAALRTLIKRSLTFSTRRAATKASAS